MDLPIDLIPNTHPPRFRWKHTVVTPIGQKTVECTGIMLPGVEESLITLITMAKKQAGEIAVLKQQIEGLHAQVVAGTEHVIDLKEQLGEAKKVYQGSARSKK